MSDFSSFFQLAIFLKIALLILVGFYAIFTMVIFIQVRTMNRLIKQSVASTLIQVLSLAQIALAVSLFIAILVIL